MKLRTIAWGAALLAACRHDEAPAHDGAVDAPADVRADAPADAALDAMSDVLRDDVSAPDAKAPLDDAGIVAHWSARCGGGEVPARPFYQYHLSTAAPVGDAPRCGAQGPGGPAVWSTLALAAGESAVVRVGPEGDGVAPSVRVFEACGGACVTTRERRDGDGTRLVWWRNESSAARTFQLAVGAAEPGVRGRFWVWPRVGATGENSRCETAQGVARVFPTATQPLGDAPSTCGARSAPTVWYAFALGTGDRLVARTEPVYFRLPAPPHPADLHVLTGCDGACVAPVAPAVDWMNEGAPVTVRLGLTQPDPNGEASGSSLDAEVRAAPENARCERAMALPDTVPATTVWSASAAPACVGDAGARAVYYRVTLGAGETVSVAGERGTSQQRFAVLDACGGACVGTSTFDATRATARWTNTATTARTVIVAATGVPRAYEWSHAMTSAHGVTEARARCASATRVTDGMVLRGERPVLTAAGAPCGATNETGAYYYAARVGAGETLMLWGGGRFRVLDGCATDACLDLGGSTWRDDALVWRNEGTTAREVIVAMSLPHARENLAVDLRVAIGRPPYTMGAIAAACEDASAGREVRFTATFLGSTGSAWQALPFELPYWGATMRAWRLAANGGVWLSGAATPEVLPAYGGPMGDGPTASLGAFVAPLFDARTMLLSVGAMRVLSVAGARPHMTIDWSTTGARTAPWLHHQLRLFADGAIEFHYCDVQGATTWDATGAWVGMQGGDPPAALRWTAGVADAVRAGLGVRFTPR